MTIDKVAFETREADHIDKRRVLASAFNGEFEASYIGALIPHKNATFSYQESAGSWLFYIVSGEASIEAGGQTYHLQNVEEKRDRLIVPSGVDYEVRMGQGSALAFATTRETMGVYSIQPVHGEIQHLFSKSWAGFTAKQLKFLMPFDQDVILGGHYHDYQEAYSMLRGECTFRLEDVADPSKREEVLLSAELGNHFSMRPQLAHVAKAGARSILVGYTAEAFEGADSAIKYQNDWLLFKE